MNIFAQVPIWRFILWGALAALGVAFLGRWLQRPQLFVTAPLAGVGIGLLGFFAQWVRSRPRLARPLVWLYIICLLVWLAIDVLRIVRR